MRSGDVVNILERHIQETGAENTRRAYENAGAQIGDLLRSGKLDKSHIRMGAILEGSLKQIGKSDVLERGTDIYDVTEAISQSAFPKLTRYIVSNLVIEPFEYLNRDLSALYTEGSTNKSDKETIAGFTSSEGVEYVATQHPYQETDFHEKTADIYLHKYGRMISLTMETVMEDKADMIIQKASELGSKFAEQFEQYIIQTIELRPRSLNSAFESTSSMQCAVFDETAVSNANFYSADHSSLAYMGAQTNANLVTSSLSTSGLNNAYILFSSMKDEDGDTITVNPKILLIHPTLSMTAFQLTGSALQYDTSNNAVNPWSSNGLADFRVVRSPFLYTSSNWYFGDPKRQLAVLWGVRPRVDVQRSGEAEFRRDVVMTWKFSTLFGAGHKDYRYIVRSSNGS